MFGTGAFARLAGVSVRTLHYYDELGLIRPATVDPHTGYRWYAAAQLGRLNRILALRDLGFTLADLGPIVDDHVSAGELRGMLRLRQVEAHERLAREAARLARVEARLRQIDQEDEVSDYDIVVKPVAPQTVAVRTENTEGFGEQLSVILPRLYAALHGRLAELGMTPTGPAIAYYEDSGDDEKPIRVVAAVPVDRRDSTPDDLVVCDLPALARAVTTVHHGSMDHVDVGYRALMHWAETTREPIDGYSREVYLDCDGPPDTWVTELQFALADAGARR